MERGYQVVQGKLEEGDEVLECMFRMFWSFEFSVAMVHLLQVYLASTCTSLPYLFCLTSDVDYRLTTSSCRNGVILGTVHMDGHQLSDL